jgi:hypothetical protein
MPHLIERSNHRDRLSDIEFKKFELRMVREMKQIPPRSGNQIINPHNAVTVRQQAVAKVGADESSGTRDQMMQSPSINNSLALSAHPEPPCVSMRENSRRALSLTPHLSYSTVDARAFPR